MDQRNNWTTVIMGWRRKRKIRECPTFFGSSINEKGRARAVSPTLTRSDGANATIVPLASSKCKLDNKPQLKVRMTLRDTDRETL